MVKTPAFSKCDAARFALRRMSTSLKADILANEKATKRWDLDLQGRMSMANDLQVRWELLFSLLRSAVDCTPAPALVDIEGKIISATVSIDTQGGAVVDTSKYKIRYPHVVLIASDKERRLAELERIISSFT